MYSLGTKKDLKWLRALRNRSDIVVMGASTLRAFKGPCLPEKKRASFSNAVLTVNAEGFDPRWRFFQDGTLKRTLFFTGKMSAVTRKKLSPYAELIPLDGKRSVAQQMIKELRRMGHSQILVEGGGGVMWEFVKEDLMDDFYVTLTPKILGGITAPSLVSGEGLLAGEELNLRLKDVKKIKDELYLHYVRAKPSSR